MNEHAPRAPLQLVRRYAKLVNEDFGLVRVLPGGRALEIESGGGRCVLKFDTDAGSKRRRREALAMAERLGASAGWPVPSFDLAEDDEYLFARQSLMPGVEMSCLTQPLVDDVVSLVDAAKGLGREQASDWPARLVDTLVAEPANPTMYCDHEPLRQHSDAGARLINVIEELAAGVDPEDLGEADDLMHWDLHPGNVLVKDGRVSAIIDLDNAGPGRREFDLITFALSVRVLTDRGEAHDQVLDLARSRVSEAFWRAAIAHLVLRFANWGLRTGHVSEAEFWISEGERLLRSGVE